MKKQTTNPETQEILFSGIQEAKDAKTKAEKKLAWIKMGMPITIVAQLWLPLIFIVVTFLPSSSESELSQKILNFMMIAWIVVVLAALIISGGLGSALSRAWQICKKIGYVGWFVIPFPVDLVTGPMLTAIAMCFFFTIVLFAPLYFVMENKKEKQAIIEAATKYMGAAGV